MNDLNKKFDLLLKKERRSKIRLILIILVIVAAIAVIVRAATSGSTSTVIGKATGFHSNASQSIQSFSLLVELESGEVKRIKVPRSFNIKIGSKVVLLKRETELLGFVSYKFQSVANNK